MHAGEYPLPEGVTEFAEHVKGFTFPLMQFRLEKDFQEWFTKTKINSDMSMYNEELTALVHAAFDVLEKYVTSHCPSDAVVIDIYRKKGDPKYREFKESLNDMRPDVNVFGHPPYTTLRYVGPKADYVKNVVNFGKMFQKHTERLLKKVKKYKSRNVGDEIAMSEIGDVTSIRRFEEKYWTPFKNDDKLKTGKHDEKNEL
ncbi:hypothetical protein Ddc_02141 [Ditylenchus destructor]|nr:hypothetical protein Ddc_02141 [Ditylenchus destructor]